MSPEEIEKVVGGVSVDDVRRVANEKLWDQDLAISARTFPTPPELPIPRVPPAFVANFV
jgi:hypothetical protein